MKIPAGIVGAGYMGLNHAACYDNDPACDLVAFFEPFPVSARKFQELYPATLQCDTLAELASYCDSVSICSPTSFHTSQALELLDYGCDLLIEKPVSDKLSDHLKLKDLAEKRNQLVQVGLVEQFNPVVKYIQKNCKNPDFVSLLRVSPFSPRGADVSVVHDLTVHDIGILVSLFDEPPLLCESVQRDMVEFSTGVDINASFLTFSGEKKAVILTQRCAFSKSRQVTLSKDQKTYAFDLILQEGSLVSGSGSQPLEIPQGDALRDEVASFLKACRESTPPTNSLDFSLKVFSILEKLQQQ